MAASCVGNELARRTCPHGSRDVRAQTCVSMWKEAIRLEMLRDERGFSVLKGREPRPEGDEGLGSIEIGPSGRIRVRTAITDCDAVAAVAEHVVSAERCRCRRLALGVRRWAS